MPVSIFDMNLKRLAAARQRRDAFNICSLNNAIVMSILWLISSPSGGT